jgi:uncharacterized protein (DUF1697 family)
LINERSEDYTPPGMTQCIALLRGINVGRAKRVPMADLRALVEGLGFSNVRTLLNTGNVVFETPRPGVAKISTLIEGAIQRNSDSPCRSSCLQQRIWT